FLFWANINSGCLVKSVSQFNGKLGIKYKDLGSHLYLISQAAAGGILRTFLGRPVKTFAANLGRCSIMRAELRAAEFGLMIAWDMGYKKVHLSSWIRWQLSQPSLDTKRRTPETWSDTWEHQ
ncbi:hypothetical protein LINPERPRIM_LOCUS10129, partial [Linum perenne]